MNKDMTTNEGIVWGWICSVRQNDKDFKLSKAIFALVKEGKLWQAEAEKRQIKIDELLKENEKLRAICKPGFHTCRTCKITRVDRDGGFCMDCLIIGAQK